MSQLFASGGQSIGISDAQEQEGREELLHVQGQEGRPWGDTARPRYEKPK